MLLRSHALTISKTWPIGFLGALPALVVVMGTSSAGELHTTCVFPDRLPFVAAPVSIDVTVLEDEAPAAGVLVRVAIEVLEGALAPGQIDTRELQTDSDGQAVLVFEDGVLGEGRVRFAVSTDGVGACESEPYDIASGPRLALHALPRSSGLCQHWPPNTPCSEYRTSRPPDAFYDVYVVVAHVDSGADLGAVTFGVSYDPAVRVFTEAICTGGMSFSQAGPDGDWPASGSGLRVTWPCPTVPGSTLGGEGLHAPVACLSVYAYGNSIMEVTPNRGLDPPEFRIETCGSSPAWNLRDTDGGRVAFSEDGSDPGFNPCRIEEPPEPPPPPPDPAPPAGMDVLLHIAPAPERVVLCSSIPGSAAEVVTSAETSPEGSEYVVYLLGTREMGGIQTGITYDADSPETRGLWMQSWHHCSDLEFRQDDWPGSGTGNTLTWMGCVEDSLAAAGYFEIVAYAPSALAISPHPATDLIKVATCRYQEFVLKDSRDRARLAWVSLGGAAFGADVDGCNPILEACRSEAPTPVKTTTWGNLKTRFRR